MEYKGCFALAVKLFAFAIVGQHANENVKKKEQDYDE
jgi:hypothetical protein